MADIVRKVDYYYTEVPHKTGEGARVLGVFKRAGVNLLAFSSFPGDGNAQHDLCPADGEALKACCQHEGIKLMGPKPAPRRGGRAQPLCAIDSRVLPACSRCGGQRTTTWRPA
ncbi:hypothetical protein HY251_09315 [bacterium]|nr:hypothetical protein [bacterium]